MTGKARARAHGNIALIKYWGKEDEELIIPMNSSLSLTIEALYTETEVDFSRDYKEDSFYLNSILQGEGERTKITCFLDLFRQAAGINERARVRSRNFVATGAGLASSASGYAALAAAANVASGLNCSLEDLSKYARRGSGSACRSIFPGFVQWVKGHDHDSSRALALDPANWDIGMVIIIVNSREKSVSSREGMKRTVATSPFHRIWTQQADKDIEEAKEAIRARDLESLGSISERNGLMMHASMLGAVPPLSYWEPESVRAMEIVRELRGQGVAAYFTMDAGPNVKVLSRLSDMDKIKERFMEEFPQENIITTGPGPGIQIL